MNIREEFEKRFPVPNGVKWSEKQQDYTYECIQVLQVTCSYSGKWQAWQAARESEGGEALGLRHALQRVDPLSFNNFDELLGEMQRNGITCAPQPDKWIPCSERLPTEADEDFHSCVWVCFIGGEIELHEAQEVIDTWDDDFAITHWMPTGLTRPAPPEQESE